MPVIYYSYYNQSSESISAVAHKEHELGRKLLKIGLAESYGLTLTMEQLEASLSFDANGKPSLSTKPDIHFNITHCTGFVACGFHNSPIGIDAELPGYFADILITRALSPTEREWLDCHSDSLTQRQEWFYRFWTLKEAYVKQSGIGVDCDLTSVSFTFPCTPIHAKKTDDGMSIACSDKSVSYFQTKLANGQILSLCYKTDNENIKLINTSVTVQPSSTKKIIDNS